MKNNLMASLLIGSMLVGSAHANFFRALGKGLQNLVECSCDAIGDAADSIVDAGADIVSDLGFDNDCVGESVTDHFCQAAGGAEAVNSAISSAITAPAGVGGGYGEVVDTVTDAAVNLGGQALNAVGVDNDCVGDSIFDQACQSFGGAEAVNSGISDGIQMVDYLIGQAADAAIDYGADIVSDLGFDNDCVGDSLFDQACQSFGGAEAVNGQLSNALQNPSDTYNSLSEGYDTYIGEGDIWDTAYDHGQDYLNDNYGDAYNNFYDSYDTYDSYGDDYYSDDYYSSSFDNYDSYGYDSYGGDYYYSSGFDNYDSYSYGDSYGGSYDSYSSGGDFWGRKLLLKK